MSNRTMYTLDLGTELVTVEYGFDIDITLRRIKAALEAGETPSFKDMLKAMLWLEEQREKYPTQEKPL